MFVCLHIDIDDGINGSSSMRSSLAMLRPVAADDEVAMENEVASKVDPQRGQSVRSDIAIVTTHQSPVCIFTPLSVSAFFLAVRWKSRARLERC
jgi:hypothetical protein